MLRIIGALLVLYGSLRFGFCYREEIRQNLERVRYLQKILEMFQSEIRFSKASLPEACYLIGRKVEQPYARSLLKIHEEMGENRGIPFSKVWRAEMEKCLIILSISKKEKDIFLDFAGCSGFADNEMQVRSIEQYASLLNQSIKRME